MPTNKDASWDWEIKAETSWWGSSLRELWSYRHLVSGLIRRDFLLGYQQTVLGPLWVLLQPVMTMLTYVVVFGKLIGLSTGQTPPVLFYLTGIILWNLFNDGFTGTSSIYRDNAPLFSKVYFPRVVVPIAQFGGYLVSFGIQCLFLLLVLGYYLFFTNWSTHPVNWLFILITPVVALLVATQSLALGLLFSVLTGKYRDVKFVVGLGVRLLMFLTPVIYPLQSVAAEWQWAVQLNPLTPLFELFRWALLGQGTFSTAQLLYSFGLTVALFMGALLMFNKQGDKLIDVV